MTAPEKRTKAVYPMYLRSSDEEVLVVGGGGGGEVEKGRGLRF